MIANALRGRGWVKVNDLCRELNANRREIRDQASLLGLACSNDGIALMSEISPAERRESLARIRSQCLSMFRRYKKMKRTMLEIEALRVQEELPL